jgi:predicted phage-related endonuclease
MIVLDMEQGTDVWKAVRCGIPTASNFDRIVTTKGEPSKQRQKYLYQLVGERITGIPEETYQNGAMQRGIQMEEEARKLYQFLSGEIVTQVGFCMENGYGASPDGVVSEDGLLEVKCPMLANHVGYLIENCLPSEYFQQTQGQLLVTGRKWLDFMSYYPGIKPLIIRVERDEKFLLELEKQLRIFCTELDSMIEKIGMLTPTASR